ncbi:hypothetical protein PSEUDO8BK_31053 [Pseudomonas sp. 8BK]|nr:hypothetical protein PSEUDO8BK_31053 [Pseudomonas sp. 8BK]
MAAPGLVCISPISWPWIFSALSCRCAARRGRARSFACAYRSPESALGWLRSGLRPRRIVGLCPVLLCLRFSCHELPCRLRRLLHCPLDKFSHSWYARWQAGGCALRAAGCE